MRRLLVALLLTVACSSGQAPPPGTPEWLGPPLDETATTGTEIVVTPVAVRDPERVAAELLGAGAEVDVTEGAPVVVKASRPVAPGEAPDEATALAAARQVLERLGLAPKEWVHRTVVSGASVRTVLFEATDEVPMFAFGSVRRTAASVRVDPRGPHQIDVAPVRLAPRRVAVTSQRLAFDEVTKPGRYVRVRLVLADDGKGVLRPYWEFASETGDLVPVLAVLTP